MNKSHWGDLDWISGPSTFKSDALPTELWRIAEGGFQKFIMPLAYKYIYIKNKQKARRARARAKAQKRAQAK